MIIVLIIFGVWAIALLIPIMLMPSMPSVCSIHQAPHAGGLRPDICLVCAHIDRVEARRKSKFPPRRVREGNGDTPPPAPETPPAPPRPLYLKPRPMWPIDRKYDL